MNRGFSTEAKVGLFVLAALMVLFYMTFRIGGFKYRKGETYPVYAEFSNVGGLEEGADVLISGVRVGKVGKIRLEYNKALVELLINKDVKLDVDTQALIRTYGVMGDKYVELILPEKFKEQLPPGGKIKVAKSVRDFDQLIASIGDVAENIKGFTKTLADLLGGEQAKNIKEIIANFKDASISFKNILAKNENKIGNLIDNLNSFSKNASYAFNTMNRVLSDVKRGKGTIGKLFVDERLYNEMKRTFENVNAITSDIREGKGTLGKLVKDESLYTSAKKTFANLDRITTDISQGKGTLGKLIKDETLYNDVKTTFANVKVISSKVAKGEGTLGKLVNNDTLYNEASVALKKIGRAGESLQEQTPITTLGAILGILF